MIDKIKKYLLRHKQINFYKKNNSGSEYYQVGNSIIRVSDHVAISNNRPDTLNIVVNGDNFVVMYGNRIINVNDYEDFKKFLKYHIQMCDCFKDLINKGLSRTKDPKPVCPRVSKPKISPVEEKRVFIWKGEEFDVSDLTAGQVNSLYAFDANHSFSKRESVVKTIESYRLQNR